MSEKRKLEEEESESEIECVEKEDDGVEEDSFEYVIRTFTGEDGEEYYETDDDDIRYDDGRKMCIRLQKEYHKQVKESEGFDITLDLTLGTRFWAPIFPRRGEEEDPEFVDLSHKAIEEFNSQHDTNYKFVKIQTVNTSLAAGIWCYITFLAADTDDNDPNGTKTFQTVAWSGIDGKKEVRFCRLKQSSD